MRGLLYKDVAANRINVICMGIVIVYLTFSMGLLIWENNKNGASDYDSLSIYVSLLTGIIALNFSFPAFGIDCSFGDIKTKWNTYAMALPGGYKRMILAKYLLGIIGHILAIACSFIMILVCNVTADIEIDLKLPVMLMLVVTGGVLIIQAIVMPFILKSHAGLVRIIFGIIFLLVLYGVFVYIAFGDISFFKEGDILFRVITWVAHHENKLWIFCWGLLGAGVVSELLSYIVTIKTYLKD